jgi:hypothetical protein
MICEERSHAMIYLAMPLAVMTVLWAIFFLRRGNTLYDLQLLLIVGSLALPFVAALLACVFVPFVEGDLSYQAAMHEVIGITCGLYWLLWPFSIGVVLVATIQDDENTIKAVIVCLCVIGVGLMAALRGGWLVWVIGLPYLIVPVISLLLWTYVPALVCRIRGDVKLPVLSVDGVVREEEQSYAPREIPAFEEDLGVIPLADHDPQAAPVAPHETALLAQTHEKGVL